MSTTSPFHNNDDVLQQLFLELFREHEHKLYVFVVKILRSDAHAKDIVQDVFLKLWTIRDQLHEIENMDAFLYRLAENKVYDCLMASAGREKGRQELWHRMQQEVPGQPEIKEYHYLIQQAIEQLPAQRRAVYLVNNREALKQQEFTLSPYTVRNQLAQALRSIRDYVKKNLQFYFTF